MRVHNKKLNTVLTMLTLVSVLSFVFNFSLTTYAAPNLQINYQGKLTDASNVAVPDGTYNMRFWLLTSSSIATTSAVWTESLTGSNKVQVTNGLFSIMLGSTSVLTSVDFNQTLYLGVEIGGTTTPGWDGEMSPRKILGAVPAAFEADRLDGLTSSQFVRSDTTATIASSSVSTLLTVTQNGAGDILNLFDGSTEVFSVIDGGFIGIGSTTPSRLLTVNGDIYGANITATGTLTAASALITNGTTTNATSTNLRVSSLFTLGSDTITDLTGSGLINTSNALTCATANSATFGCLTTTDWSAFNAKVGSTSIDTSAELAALLTDETGTAGNVVFSTNPLLAGFRSNASSTIGDGTATGGLTISGNSTTTGNAYFAGNVGVGTTSPVANFSLSASQSGPLARFYNSNGNTATVDIGSVISNAVLYVNDGGSVVPIFKFNGTYGGNTLSVYGQVDQDSTGAHFNIDTGGSTRFIVSNGGNVGIGTTTPAQNLQVANGASAATFRVGVATSTGSVFDINAAIGTGPTNGVRAALTRVGSDWNTPALFNFHSNSSVYWSMGLRADSTHGDDFFIGNSDNDSSPEFVIDRTTGNIGVGTSSPGSLLSVQGNAYIGGNLTATGTLNITGQTTLTTASSTGLTATNLYATLLNTLGTTTLATSGGNVGIGTSTPSGILAMSRVNGNQTPLLLLESKGGSSQNFLTAYDTTNSSITAGINSSGALFGVGLSSTGNVTVSNGMYYGFDGGSSSNWNVKKNGSTLAFTTNGAETLTVGSTGNLGIGSTTPGYKLSVVGDGYFGGNLTATGTLNISGQTTLTTASSTGLTATNLYATLLNTLGTTTLATSGGNVGIGTTTPGAQLTLSGTTGNLVNPTMQVGSTYGGITLYSDTYNNQININGAYGTTLKIYNQDAGQPAIVSNTMLHLSTTDSTSNGYIDFRTNSLERVRIDNSGNVGIGSTTPAYKLSVVGDGYFGGNLTATGTLNITGQTTLTTASSTGLTATNLYATLLNTLGTTTLATSGGNVGIGTPTPGSKLEIYGAGQTVAALTDSGARTASLALNDSGSSAGSGAAITFGNSQSNTAGTIGWAAIKGFLTNGGGNTFGDLTFSTRNTTSDTALTERMRILGDGNIGIGTTTPIRNLDVSGASATLGLTSSSGATTLVMGNRDSSALPSFIQAANGNTYLGAGTSFASATGGTLSYALTALANGNVGIGTTTPLRNLHISGSGNPEILIEATGYSVGSNGRIWGIGNDATGNLFFRAANGGITGSNTAMTMTAGGGVGIGTTTPTEKLYVDGGTEKGKAVTAVSNADAVTKMYRWSGTGNGYYPWYVATGRGAGGADFSIMGGNSAIVGSESVSDYLTVKNDGNVGIGSTTPSRLLTVNGDIYGANITATGTLTAASALITNGTTTNATSTTFRTTTLGVGTDYLTDITGTGLSLVNGSLSAPNQSNWLYNGSRLSPSTTVGIGIFASSTIGDGTATGGLTISGNSTTTGNAYFAGNVGIGTTTPSAFLDVQAGTSTIGAGLGINLIAQHALAGTSNLGGSISITAGNSTRITSGGNIGGGITIAGGAGAWVSGIANNARGGPITVIGGTGGSTGTGGVVTIQGGTSGNTAGAGGAVSVYGGSSIVSTGGAANLRGGSSAEGAGGPVTVGGGDAFTTLGTGNFAGGAATLSGGASQGTAVGGSVTIQGGSNSGADGTPGGVLINGGSNPYTSSYADVVLQSGGGKVGIGATSPWAHLSISGTVGSQIALLDIASTSSGVGTSSLFTVLGSGKVAMGSTTPEGHFTIDRNSLTGAQVAGIKEYLKFVNSTESAIYYGDNAYIVNSPTATSTLVGKIIRIEDNSQLGNTVRGLEVQAHRGTTTKGENTGISGFGRTFGIRGTTEGDAGDTYIPAGVMAESRGTTQGNALRAYSGTITSSSLAYLFHDTSAFTGTGLLMNFGNTTGSFASTSSKFIDLQNAGTSKFTVTAHGTTTIGDGTTANMAGLQIGYGGICVDNDGSCSASTTGKITSVSSATGNSDLAEMYFSSDELEPGDIVMTSGALSIARAERANNEYIIGVVSTKPGLIMGYDDSSLTAGQQGYPVALKGRVPIKLSTEQGSIQKGDRIALSTIPGVGMKATSGDIVVGIALEDYDGTKAYSEGYFNQFGDDLVKAKLQPRNYNTDTRTQDGCSYGAGNEQGDTSCVKDAVKTITPETVSVDTKTAALRELRAAEASTMYTESGEAVTVGQALMFVDLDYYALETERNVLGELLATTSREIDGREETLWDRLKLLAENFVDGVLRVAGIRTNELCVGNTCVDEATFLRMVQSAQVSGSTDTDSSDTPPPSDAPADTTTEPIENAPVEDTTSGTTTEEVIPETQASAEAPVVEESSVSQPTEEEISVSEVSEPPTTSEEPVVEEISEPVVEPSSTVESSSELVTESAI